jgi:hypothetical protein
MKTAQVINAINMIGMGMAEKHGINALYLLAQRLAPQICRRINQNGVIVVADQKR